LDTTRRWNRQLLGLLSTTLDNALAAMNILHVVGARPNFMKVAPVYKALREKGISRQTVVHTGQHYDGNMSDIFFRDLGIPSPDVNLHVGSGSHAEQTGTIMMRFEPIVLSCKPDLVLVYGDVNSTVAASLVCAKLQVPIGHVEAGLRSLDRSMPEEINRIVTDSLGDALFTPSEDANENLAHEGIPKERIFFVGNVMIDSLLQLLPLAFERYESLVGQLKLQDYGLVTLHRPSNVDDDETLFRIYDALEEISHDLPLIFPVHPRTRGRLASLPARPEGGLRLIEPLGYLDFLSLEQHARLVITDSGGIQEETTCLRIPCITLRENTERPVTVSLGTNTLVGRNMDRLKQEVRAVLAGEAKKGKLPPLWDGNASVRISDVITSGAWRFSSPTTTSCAAT
jgi:UDP-N-acetylglucosamine 2-epimerase (non-hydrolysing)